MNQNVAKVKKAIILAAGRGTRFLPITKSIPKEMLPIGNYPTIHYLLEECKLSGITDVCIVLKERGGLTEDYFQSNKSLEKYLQENKKDELYELIKDTSLGLNLTFIKQNYDFPLGHAASLLSAKEFIDGEDFAMIFCDDIVKSKVPGILQLLNTWNANPSLSALLMTSPISLADISKFSSIKYGDEIASNFGGISAREVIDFIEKPQNSSQYFEPECFIGRGIFSANIFAALEHILEVGILSAGEFSTWDGYIHLGKTGNLIAGQQVNGKWLTTGTPEQMKIAYNNI